MKLSDIILRVKIIFAFLFFYSGLCRLRERLIHKNKAIVLMYHRVLAESENKDNLHPGMYVSTLSLDLHLRYLSKYYSIVTLDELQQWKLGRMSFEKTPCVITFDDGWRDNYTNAFPLLKKYDVPATIFLVTGAIDTPDYLSTAQIVEMEEEKINFGSHTVSHCVLTEVPRDELEYELLHSREALKRYVKCPSDWFCYPKGGQNTGVRVAVEKYYRSALTTIRGNIARDDGDYLIKRLGFHDDVSSSVSLFACRLAMIL